MYGNGRYAERLLVLDKEGKELRMEIKKNNKVLLKNYLKETQGIEIYGKFYF